MNLINEVLRELQRGTSVRQCALRFGITQPTVYRYRNGTRGRHRSGRPRALSAVQEHVCWRCWSQCEATLYELATIYQVTPQTMRNVIRRQMQLQFQLQLQAQPEGCDHG